MNSFNDVLLKALRRAKEKNYSDLDTVSLVSDYLDIAGIPIPGAPPTNEPIQLIYQAPQPEPQTYTTGGNFIKGETISRPKSPIITNHSIQSPIDLQIKTLDELYSEIQSLAPNEVTVDIPESNNPLAYAVEVSKVNNDPNAQGYIRIKYVDPNDRGTCFNQSIYYPSDTININKDIDEFKDAMLKVHTVRTKGISTSFQKITAPPSVFDGSNAMNLGHIVVDGRR